MFASPWKDTLIILVVVLLFFGPKRLPALSRSIGESIKEFKGGITPGSSSDTDETSELSPSASDTAGAPKANSTSATSEHTNA